jgi:hypothetical protein
MQSCVKIERSYGKIVLLRCKQIHHDYFENKTMTCIEQLATNVDLSEWIRSARTQSEYIRTADPRTRDDTY